MITTKVSKLSKKNRADSRRRRNSSYNEIKQAHKSGFTKSANPKKKFDEYTSLARVAASSGDVIDAENLYQHAEHFFRLM
ncbi:MAG: DUF4167 domain-containing protein, partial [Desulfobulbia bacterium]